MIDFSKVVDLVIPEGSVFQIKKGTTTLWQKIKDELAFISGKLLTLVNCTRREPLNDFKIYGKSEQTQYQGYNLFPSVEEQTKTQGGITLTCDGKGTYHVFGTTVDHVEITLNIQEYIIPKSISSGGGGCLYLGNSNVFAGNVIFFNNYAQLDYWGFNSIDRKIATYDNLMNDKACNRIKIAVFAGATVDCVFKLMFTNDGSTSHEFEPYVGGIPSPNPQYPQEIKSVENPIVELQNGIYSNLLTDFQWNWLKNNYDYWKNAVAVLTKNYEIYLYFVNVSGNYRRRRIRTTSVLAEEGTSASDMNYWCNTQVKNSNAIGIINNYNDWFIADSNNTIGLPNGESKNQSYQFNHTLYGIPVSSGGNYTDESGQQWIADYVDVENKKLWHWCEERIITQNDIYGNVNVSSGRGINYINFRVQAPYSTVAWKSNIGFSDIGFIVSAFDGAWVTDKGISFANRGTYGWIGNSDWKTKEEFLNALPITFIYKLDEPYSEDLTEEEVQAFLQMKTYKPTTIVSNNYDAHMSTSYHTKLEQLDVAMTREYNELINELKGE